MPNKKRHSWSPPDWLKDPEATTVIFHDQTVEVYEGKVDTDSIRLWRENDRTLLDIVHLVAESGQKDVRQLSDEDIISSIVKKGLHKITNLAKSIKMNGVRLPLILTYEKELLDGNRRFIACKYLLATEKEKDEKFGTVTAYCLKPHLSKSLRYKIISEMNFLPDHKEQWPQEVRAKYITELFNEYKAKQGEEKAVKEVAFLLDVKKSDIYRFIDVLQMIDEYIKFTAKKSEEAKKEAEVFAREKFHFFEEFYNKDIKNKQNQKAIKEDKDLFYTYLFNKQLISTTGIREFAGMLQYSPTRKIIKSQKETLDYAKSFYDDIVIPKRASSKIERFCEWLESLSKKELKSISGDIKERLLKAIKRLGK
ncbi:MAG: ParB/Srx family N-terminal domain-containing protein [Candidatus Omnitrophica bacterium]|nr:ParB/Srx family N-terminal domain-containing protein [Candidatus Omnitrophota bacterium]